MNGKLCFFIGHRDANDEIFPLLAAEVNRHISTLGVTEFIVGHYGHFDRLAAKAVIKAKQTNASLHLYLLLPYHPWERPIDTPDGFDGTVYPPDMESVPRRFAIVRANRYMVDHTDFLIAYGWRPGSNAKKLLDYGKRRQAKGLLQITQLPYTPLPCPGNKLHPEKIISV